MQYSIKTCYTLSKYCNDPNVVNCPNVVKLQRLLIVHIHERNVLNCPTVVNDPNVVIKCKKNTHHTLGAIPKSTTSMLVVWYR